MFSGDDVMPGAAVIANRELHDVRAG
jgi:hypothetical protein